MRFEWRLSCCSAVDVRPATLFWTKRILCNVIMLNAFYDVFMILRTTDLLVHRRNFRSMATLAGRITVLEKEISGYVTELSVPGISEAQKVKLMDTINRARETLNLLLAQQNAAINAAANAQPTGPGLFSRIWTYLFGSETSVDSHNIDVQVAVASSLILTMKMKKCECSASGVAISSKRALTALHGKIPVGTRVDIRTRNGTKLFGVVEFERFEPNLVDIAVILLDSPSTFAHFMVPCLQPVVLDQPLRVIGLKYAAIGDSVSTYVRRSYVEMIEEYGDSSALFQAQYYSFDGCSGAGVVTVAVGNRLEVVGVHVASHEDSTVTAEAPSKKKRGNTEFNFEASIASAIHGHKAYSLVCEISRVPDLVELLNG